MTNVKNKVPHSVISWFSLLYFVILFAERLQSLVRAATANQLFADSFEGVASVTVSLSLLSAVVLLAFFNKYFWKSLTGKAKPDYSMMSITAGVILVSGMIHTEYTVPGIQFASYGMLIAAMILRVIQLAPESKNRFGLWYSLGYLTVFSMAIPVVYKHYSLTNAILFHVMEYLVMLALVFSFALMLRRLFSGRGENLLLWIPFAIMAIGDTVILLMGWTAEVNTFVLIFAVLSVIVFILGKIIFAIQNKS
ncbi:MAG: hypothetical protein UFA98_05950 [Ruminococcus sp.]|nr:hypothetical protein [Ruminococcus sp.]